MSETKIDDDNIFEGLYPDVFKKIDSADIQITPFQASKTFTVFSGSATSSMLPLQGIYIDTNELPAIGSNLSYNSSSNIDGSLQSVTYFSINHLFYKRKNEPFNTFGPTNLNRTNKFLYQTASIFSIPQIKIGETIKPASFNITSSVSGSYESDIYGNIIDTAFDTSSIVSDVRLYEGFNEYFDTTRINYKSDGVTYINGIPTTSGRQLSIGLAAQFNGAGFIQQELPGFYDRDNDYAISFFISGGNTTNNDQVIMTKATSSLTTQFPFKIELTGTTFLTDEDDNILMTEDSDYLNLSNNKIQFSAQGATNYKSIINSTSSVSSSWTHVVCQKSGSNLQLYISGTLEASEFNQLLKEVEHPLSASARIDNTQDLLIGGYNISGSDLSFIIDQNDDTIITQDNIPLTTQNNLHDFNLQGQLDEIRIFNKSLTTDEIANLGNRSEGGPVLQTQYVGNVFGKQGHIVFSSIDYRINDLLNTPYTASYKSTVTIQELAVTTRLGRGDFNMSNNITLTKDDNYTYRDFVSGSAFAPYVTSIGLYNDSGQLLAVGKLAQPIRKRNDVDINFLVRIDLDKELIK